MAQSIRRRRPGPRRSPLQAGALLVLAVPVLLLSLLLSTRRRVVLLSLTALLIGGLFFWQLAPSIGRRVSPAAARPPLVPTPASEPCRFTFGFATLHDLVPEAVGDCLENESSEPATGDTVQRTTTGLLVWRKAENTPAFTDGRGTWLNGPNGLAYRPNTQRFPWESNPLALPVAAEQHPSNALPGALLPANRVVSYYGNPGSPAMGVLGQRTPDEMLAALDREAQRYAAVDPATPVRQALQLVAVVATGSPGPDGMYRRRAEAEEIERVARWADSRGHLLILDIQPGLAPWAAEVEALTPYLSRPNVHLALDPEWAMPPGQIPGRSFGTMDASVVNETIQTMASLVSRNRLPPKLLIVHRFRDDMLTNSPRIRPDPRVQVVIAMDGVGSQGAKTDVYRQVVRDQPVQFGGLKIFYTQDVSPFTPRQAISLQPVPYVVIFQ